MAKISKNAVNLNTKECPVFIVYNLWTNITVVRNVFLSVNLDAARNGLGENSFVQSNRAALHEIQGKVFVGFVVSCFSGSFVSLAC